MGQFSTRIGDDGEVELPDDGDDLGTLLKERSIDTSKWPQGALESLYNQLRDSECSLRLEDADGSKPYYVRHLRVLTVQIGVQLADGLRNLKSVSIKDEETGLGKSETRNCAKKILMHDELDGELPRVLLNELELKIPWQEKHLERIHQLPPKVLESGHDRGKSFPGLCSKYIIEEVWFRIKDVHAEGVAGKLNLPSAEGTFEIQENGIVKDKTRRWCWREPVDEERPLWEEKLKEKSQ